MEAKTKEAPDTPKKRNPVFIIILALLVICGAWFAISKFIYSRHHEGTTDAQVNADISLIIPRVSGYVLEVKVNDNQLVKKGDTLVVLDNRDYKLNVEEAEAALGIGLSNLNSARATTSAARANIATSRASVSTVNAQIEQAQINAWRTTRDYERYSNLIKDHSITQQQFEQAEAAKQTAEKQLLILQEQKKQAAQQTSAITIQGDATASQINIANATIRQQQVAVDAAKLNLSYTIITAPQDGKASAVNVQPGQYVQAGQSLFSIVHTEKIWVVANFKETQLERMKIGQKVIVEADTYPHHEFNATLSSFSPATGSTFALLPPDNASGNFVKVVQRLPVKIEFTDSSDSLVKSLRPGMNVTVDVHLN